MMDSKIADKIDDFTRQFQNGMQIKNVITDFLNKPFFGDTMGDTFKDWIKEMTGVEDIAKDFISNSIDKAGEWVSDGVHQVGEWLNEGYERITDGIKSVIGNGLVLHGFSSAVKAWKDG